MAYFNTFKCLLTSIKKMYTKQWQQETEGWDAPIIHHYPNLPAYKHKRLDGSFGDIRNLDQIQETKNSPHLFPLFLGSGAHCLSGWESALLLVAVSVLVPDFLPFESHSLREFRAGV
jgi:hypothetical protein